MSMHTRWLYFASPYPYPLVYNLIFLSLLVWTFIHIYSRFEPFVTSMTSMTSMTYVPYRKSLYMLEYLTIQSETIGYPGSLWTSLTVSTLLVNFRAVSLQLFCHIAKQIMKLPARSLSLGLKLKPIHDVLLITIHSGRRLFTKLSSGAKSRPRQQ